MFYVYILFSEVADRYYVGQSDDPERRLEEHNNAIKNSYTSKYRPWIMKKKYAVSESRGEARRLESYIKKRLKSRREIEKLITDDSVFDKLVQLVRAIPTSRD